VRSPDLRKVPIPWFQAPPGNTVPTLPGVLPELGFDASPGSLGGRFGRLPGEPWNPVLGPWNRRIPSLTFWPESATKVSQQEITALIMVKSGTLPKRRTIAAFCENRGFRGFGRFGRTQLFGGSRVGPEGGLAPSRTSSGARFGELPDRVLARIPWFQGSRQDATFHENRGSAGGRFS
jgi:hypothetical protein